MRLLFDLETNGLLDEVSTIHCCVIKDLDTGAVTTYSALSPDSVDIALLLLQSADEIVGHNAVKYDIPVIEKLHPWWKTKAKVRDTIVLTRLIYPDLRDLDFTYVKTHPDFPKQLIGRHSLEAWGHRLGVHKAGYSDGWETFSQEMLDYCVQDIEVTHALWKKIESKKYSEMAITLEHEFATVIAAQERHGFLFDTKAAANLYATLGQRRLTIERELQAAIPGWYEDMKVPAHYACQKVGESGPLSVFFTSPNKGLAEKEQKRQIKLGALRRGETEIVAGPLKQKHTPFNPGSRDHIARFLTEKYGWRPSTFTDGGKPQIDESVLEGMAFPEAKVLTEYFMLEKRIGQLAEGDQAWLKAEKNGRIHGEVNTNGAVTGRCTHSKPNMAQVPSVGALYGAECRALFGVPSGFKLVGCDASGLELRCLAHFMARYDGGEYSRELLTGDIHTANMKAAGLATRNDSKKFIYMYLYGAGDAHIGETFGQSATWGKKIKASFLAKTPALKQLKDAVTKATKERGHLIGLDGRVLPVRSEHAALNTLLQSAGALLVKKATCLLHRDLLNLGWEFGREWANVAHIHDEFQLEVREDLADDVGKRAVAAMRAAGEFFNFRCPIDGEYKVGGNWSDTH